MLNVDVRSLSVEVALFIDQTSFSEFRRSQVTTQADWRSAIEIASGRLFAGRPPAWTLPRRPHRRSPGAKRPLRRGFNRVPELDRTARLWDPATGQEVRRFVGHTGTIGLAGAIAFTPNGKRVLTGSTDGAVRLWDVEIADTVADLCSRLQRDFTTEERAQYGIPDDGLTCAGQAGQ